MICARDVLVCARAVAASRYIGFCQVPQLAPIGTQSLTASIRWSRTFYLLVLVTCRKIQLLFEYLINVAALQVELQCTRECKEATEQERSRPSRLFFKVRSVHLQLLDI